jgi:small subunit ribosomal protein S5
MTEKNQTKSKGKAVSKSQSNTAETRRKVGRLERRKKSLLRRMEKKERVRRRRVKKRDELDIRLVSIRRVSKVKAGGKKLRMSVMAVVGDGKGNIGIALAKGKDVKEAQEKAANRAKKKMFKVPLKGQTIPHEITLKFGAAKVFLKPAAPGTGVIAGKAIRAVVEAAGIKDILSKVIGTKNIIPNVYATVEALKNLRLTRF